jgi:carbon storage regulator
MLVLSRKLGEKIRIGDNITVTVVEIDRNKIRLGIEAPDDVSIHRLEVWMEIHDNHGDDQPAKPVTDK